MEEPDRPHDDDDNGDVSYRDTDEPVSNCNRVPFFEPRLVLIALLAVLSLGCYGVCKLIELFLIRGH